MESQERASHWFFKGKSVSLFRKLRKWRRDLFWGLNIMPAMLQNLFW